MALDFWTKLKSNDGQEGQLITDKATLGMMGLGGSYDHKVMSQLASTCELVGMFGSDAKDPKDTTKYVWELLECIEDGKTKSLPLGLGIKDGKITQLEIDLFSPQVSIDRSSIGGGK